ncbi:uncharacterized protein TRIREDRAFT_105408 [Trichoderma reesei QM6a]|uniref:Predicted protein n=2 Tax=Hypocrea jecorina TaxID=51453 RepID=G0REH1_HYPJQ|nr:uncharacterized protein TRIREDRAFT_105408 [Trichoderma reesei QM6a]EGR50364.1 predicted protein [Trichoderma reesei QM6a]ETS03772.1 hypothetical protein M419DRAFT_128184 [Trichoderma reesei RUT C-30]
MALKPDTLNTTDHNSPPRPSPIPTPAITPTPTPTDIIASIITSSATSPPPTSTATSSSSSTDNGAGFMQVAEDGTSGDKLLRGFLVGMAIGILVSLVMCCWLPCLRRARRTRLQRRNDNIRRRRLVVLEDEAWAYNDWMIQDGSCEALGIGHWHLPLWLYLDRLGNIKSSAVTKNNTLLDAHE